MKKYNNAFLNSIHLLKRKLIGVFIACTVFIFALGFTDFLKLVKLIKSIKRIFGNRGDVGLKYVGAFLVIILILEIVEVAGKVVVDNFSSRKVR